jgi:methionyl-tRNA synthetase
VLGAFGDREAVPRWPIGPVLPLLDDGAGTEIALLPRLVAKIDADKVDHLTARFGA